EERDDLEEERTCERFYTNLKQTDETFRAWLYDDVRTPDEVYDRAHDRGLCGYELLKESMDSVDLVVCNYHHLLSPMIREQFFRWLDRDPGEVVTVFDEAHNIADAARDHASRTIAEGTLDGALSELGEVDDTRAGNAENVVGSFLRALRETYQSGLDAGVTVEGDWEDVVVANEDRRDDLTLAFLDAYGGRGIDADLEAAVALGRDLDASYEEAYRRGTTDTRKECPTLTAATFIRTYLEDGAATGQYPVVSVRRDDLTGEISGRAELYTCIPREVTAPLFEEVHASVLMSATLRPFEVTQEVLGLTEPETMAFGLSFPPERRRTYAVDVPPLFARNRDDPAVTDTVTDLIEDVSQFTPGNVLVFFPSYAEAHRYAQRVDLDDGTVYEDEPGVRAEDLRREFVADGH
ncbi:MAG: ATP-dependent DNA helicase, partial [Halobacteriales archaeon]|nr:ATP-dependent DNA helicase [Halobacteriales archaeon]